MDSVLLITISAFILAVILIIVTIVIIKRNQNKKYKKEIEELDIRKNNLIGVPVLSEITKVKELIKTDNLKNKLDDWDNTFTTIRDEKIPELTDLISEADFLIDRKDYKQAVKKITNIEIEINSLKKKTDHLLEEVKLITNSEERNRALITKLKIVYREDQNKFERSKKEYGVIADYLEKEIDNIDDLFAKFEKAMDNNDYVSVEKKINLLDDSIFLKEREAFRKIADNFGEDAKYYAFLLSKNFLMDTQKDIYALISGYDGIQKGAIYNILNRSILGVKK